MPLSSFISFFSGFHFAAPSLKGVLCGSLTPRSGRGGVPFRPMLTRGLPPAGGLGALDSSDGPRLFIQIRANPQPRIPHNICPRGPWTGSALLSAAWLLAQMAPVFLERLISDEWLSSILHTVCLQVQCSKRLLSSNTLCPQRGYLMPVGKVSFGPGW